MPLDISSGGAGSIASPGHGPPTSGATAANPADLGMVFADLLQGLGNSQGLPSPVSPTFAAKPTATPSKAPSFPASDTQDGEKTTGEDTDTPKNDLATPGLPITPLIVPILILTTPTTVPNALPNAGGSTGEPVAMDTAKTSPSQTLLAAKINGELLSPSSQNQITPAFGATGQSMSQIVTLPFRSVKLSDSISTSMPTGPIATPIGKPVQATGPIATPIGKPVATLGQIATPIGTPVQTTGPIATPIGMPVTTGPIATPIGTPVTATGPIATPIGMPVTTGPIATPIGTPVATTGQIATPIGKPVTTTGPIATPIGTPVATTGQIATPIGTPVPTTGQIATPIGKPVQATGPIATPIGKPVATTGQIAPPIGVIVKTTGPIATPIGVPVQATGPIATPIAVPIQTTGPVATPIGVPVPALTPDQTLAQNILTAQMMQNQPINTLKNTGRAADNYGGAQLKTAQLGSGTQKAATVNSLSVRNAVTGEVSLGDRLLAIGEKPNETLSDNSEQASDNTANLPNVFDLTSLKSGETQKAAAPNPMPTSDRAQMLQQVVDHVKSLSAPAHSGSGQINMQLNPKEWGQLDLSVKMTPTVQADGTTRTAVQAYIVAANSSVKTALDTHLGDLRHKLQEAGMQLDSMTVVVQSAAASSGMSQSTGDSASRNHSGDAWNGQTPTDGSNFLQSGQGSFGGGQSTFASFTGEQSGGNRQGTHSQATAWQSETKDTEPVMITQSIQKNTWVDTRA